MAARRRSKTHFPQAPGRPAETRVAALALADGDASRLKILSVDTVVVLNHGRKPIMVQLVRWP
jgi:hypothetical protein